MPSYPCISKVMPHLLPEKKWRVQFIKVVHVISTFNSVEFMEMDIYLLWKVIYSFFYRYNAGPLLYILNTSRERVILARLKDGISQKWRKILAKMCILYLFIIKVCVYVYILSYWNIFIVQIKPALRPSSFICWQVTRIFLLLIYWTILKRQLRDPTLFPLLPF